MNSVSIPVSGCCSSDKIQVLLQSLFPVKEEFELAPVPGCEWLFELKLSSSGGKKNTLHLALFSDVLRLPEVPFSSIDRSAFLLLHEHRPVFRKIVTKFTGREGHITAFSKLFSLSAKAAESSVVISPMMFNGKGVKKEKALVKDLLEKLGGLGFIKLPYLHLDQYLDFVQQTKADLLVLPKSEMLEFLREPTLLERSAYHSFSVFFG